MRSIIAPGDLVQQPTISIAHRVAGAGRIAAGGHRSGLRVDADGLHVADAAPARKDLELVSHRLQGGERRWRGTALDRDRDVGARLLEVRFRLEREARRFDRLLDRHVEVDQVDQDLELCLPESTMSLVAANREVYDLVKDGIAVCVPNHEQGGQKTERVRVVDWHNPGANDLLLVSQMTITGALYTCRPDLIGFVNGLPLLIVELKKPGVPARSSSPW